MFPNYVDPALIPEPPSTDHHPETLARLPGILALPEFGVALHSESREALVVHQSDDLARQILGALSLLDGHILGCEGSRPGIVGRDELVHPLGLTRLPDHAPHERN